MITDNPTSPMHRLVRVNHTDLHILIILGSTNHIRLYLQTIRRRRQTITEINAAIIKNLLYRFFASFPSNLMNELPLASPGNFGSISQATTSPTPRLFNKRFFGDIIHQCQRPIQRLVRRARFQQINISRKHTGIYKTTIIDYIHTVGNLFFIFTPLLQNTILLYISAVYPSFIGLLIDSCCKEMNLL